MAQRNGTGMFPREVMNRFPLLPLEEEGRLNDMPLRENFIERVLPVARARQGLLSLDRGAQQRTHAGGSGPCPCDQGRQVPYSTQVDADGPRALEEASALALHRDGPPRRRRGQAGVGGIGSRVRGPAHGRSWGDGYAWQAYEHAPAPARLLEESPDERGQRLPSVSWSSWASLRTTGRVCCR
jgi:hypothetical protein